MSALVFLDTETTGLELTDHIWELAAIRREADGRTFTELHLFVEHDVEKCARLPEPFQSDHTARYNPAAAVSRSMALAEFAELVGTDRPHIVGAVPNFDTERIAVMEVLEATGYGTGWHYHLTDVENLAVGYLRGLAAAGELSFDVTPIVTPPWDSEELSRAVGVDPDRFERHTAMGDVRWAMAIYDAIMGTGK